MVDAFIVDAVRTPIGRRNGGLSAQHPADLAAITLRRLVERTGIGPDLIDDIVLGCVGQLGAQTLNIARTAALSAGLPEHVPGVTVDRQCGSSQQAVHFAAQAVQSGNQDVVIAGGVEMMSVVPMGSTRRLGAENGMGAPSRVGMDGALRRGGDLPVPGSRADRPAVGDQPPGDGAVRPPEPRTRHCGHRVRGVRRRGHRSGRRHAGRGPRRHFPSRNWPRSNPCRRTAP